MSPPSLLLIVSGIVAVILFVATYVIRDEPERPDTPEIRYASWTLPDEQGFIYTRAKCGHVYRKQPNIEYLSIYAPDRCENCEKDFIAKRKAKDATLIEEYNLQQSKTGPGWTRD